ncbi:MAG TPA: universal stress protein [Bacteroidales bacterium]|nr:universal stress protein [Bacteroidales bacterium]HPS16331.1 universal stress protein [Bacteroidales bacterium]
MKSKRENIVLVPTDFTEVADFAIDHAAGIAKQINGKIAILHVINKETKAYLKKENLNDDVIKEKLKIIASSIEKKYNVKLDYIAEEGSIFTTIAKVADEIKARMIVMGTHGKIGVQHLVGSFAMKVIESSSVPVIVVQEREFGKGYNNVVFPIDETSESKQKVCWAIHIAKIFNSTIHMFGIKYKDEFQANEVERNMAQIKSILKKNGVKFTEKVSAESGNFAKSINVYSDYIKADMVMIMTNPDQLLPSFILSPWAEQVMFNSSKIPAMCVNPVELDITSISL